MITIENVSKVFRDRAALTDVSFTADDGEVTYLLGPNGAGKSTLLRSIAGLTSPDTGQILIDGARLADHAYPLCSVGFAVDGSAVNPRHTARQHLRWQAYLGGVDRRWVGQVLRTVALASVADKQVGGFSLGMRLRLAIAAALLGNPRTLVFDEPSNGLDVDGALWLRGLIRALADNGRCLLIASHDLPEIELTGDR